jgi:hypothetical protein
VEFVLFFLSDEFNELRFELFEESFDFGNKVVVELFVRFFASVFGSYLNKSSQYCSHLDRFSGFGHIFEYFCYMPC